MLPAGQTWGTSACVDLAVWRRVLALPCGPGVIVFPGRQGIGGLWGGRTEWGSEFSKEQPCDLNKPSKAQVSILVL